jgi:hypothetical protein
MTDQFSCNKLVRTVMAFVTLSATGAMKAADISPSAVFSAANIVIGETLRVNIVNLGNPTSPPDPCNVQINFVNAAGQTLKTSNVTVNVGSIGGATINFLEASQAKVPTATVAESVMRQVIRPVISLSPPDPCRAVMSAEVYDTISGKTSQYIPSIFLPAVQTTPVVAAPGQ